MTQKTPTYETTADWLLANLEAFVEANENQHWVNERSIGYAIIQDAVLFDRLRAGGAVRTHHMDKILAFLKDPVTPKKFQNYPLVPIKLKRRTYE